MIIGQEAAFFGLIFRQRFTNLVKRFSAFITIYYVVIDDDPKDPVMEVRRFLYNGQNKDELL